MRIERITIVNMRKHAGRIGLLVAALTVAVATVVALYTLSNLMNEDFQFKIDTYGTNMVIVPKSEDLALSYRGVDLGDVDVSREVLRESDIAKLRTIKNNESIAIVAPKLIESAKIKGRDSIIVGVDFKEELSIKKWWKLAEGKEPKPGSNSALLGSKAATRLDLKTGDRFTVKGETFLLAGVLEPVGSDEDSPVYIDLDRAQKIFNRGQELSLIEVAAWCYQCPIEQIVGQTSEMLPHAQASAVVQAAKMRSGVVNQFILFSIVLSAAMALIGGLIVFANMLTAVRERRREIGIFRAVGFRRLHILEIILFETVILALVSGIVGYFAGIAVAALLAPLLGMSLAIQINLTIAYFAVLGTLVVALLSSLYPALTAASLSPMTAMNDI